MTTFRCPDHGVVSDQEALQTADAVSQQIGMFTMLNGFCSRTVAFATLITVLAYCEDLDEHVPDAPMKLDDVMLPEARRLAKVLVEQVRAGREAEDTTTH